MSALTKLSYPLAILAAFALTPAPAHAQFEGAGDQMAQFAPIMEQFAPMMEQVALARSAWAKSCRWLRR